MVFFPPFFYFLFFMTSYQFDARLTYNNELLFKTCNTEIIKKKKIFLFPKLVIMMVHICDGCYFNSNFFFFSYFQEWEKLEGKKVSLFPKQLYKWGMLKSIQAQIWLVCVSSEKSGYHAEWSKVFNVEGNIFQQTCYDYMDEKIILTGMKFILNRRLNCVW